MGKRKRDEHDPIWKHGERINKSLKCRHCGILSRGTIYSFRCHLLGTEPQWVRSCSGIPQNERNEFADDCIQHGTMPPAGTSTVAQVGQPLQGPGASTMPSIGTSTVAQVGELLPGPGASTMPSIGTSTVAQVEEPLQGPGPSTMPSAGTSTIGFRLVAPNLVGGARQKTFNDIWRCLMDNSIQRIGICGMAGVGKSTLLKQINNNLLTLSNPFKNVFWVHVGQECNIFKLQSAIASLLNVSLTSSEGERATTLQQGLSLRGKSLLILDEVWEFLDLQRVGIPDDCKLIVATRPPSVCRQLACQEIIRLFTLPYQESWNLFVASLGGEPALSTHVQSVARSLVQRCSGLPLGIVAIADCMRGEADLTEWRSLLLELESLAPKPRKQVVDLFHSLKLTYDALDQPRLKEVFMLCALLQKGNYIQYEAGSVDKQCITSFLVADGLAGGLQSSYTDFVLVQHALNQLEDAGLLLFNPSPEVNGLLKLMAIWIMKERGDSIVEVVQKDLRDPPDNEQWMTNLKQVFIVNSCITEINPNDPPQCPQLLSLYLCGNRCLQLIADDFFQNFLSLQSLDLSYTEIVTLPTSIAKLVNLISLSVSWCLSLKSVEIISSLIKLEKLDMSYSGVEEVTPGMGSLSRLNYFNAIGSRIRHLPQGLLLNFCLLQFLMVTASIAGEELEAMTRLEILVCGFKLSQLDVFMEAIWRRRLKRFCLYVGPMEDLSFCEFSRSYCDLGLEFERTVKLRGDILAVEKEDDARTIRLPTDVQCLVMKNLFYDGSRVMLGGGALECMVIRECSGLESMPTNIAYEHLAVLKLASLTDLVSLLGEAVPVSLLHGAFSQLRRLSIIRCSKIERLFPSNLLKSLQNLEQLKVENCASLNIIFVDENGICKLPKLTFLKLNDLPQLEKISGGAVGFPCLQKICVVNCVKLLMFPVSLPARLDLLEVYPREWWESVEWLNIGESVGVPAYISSYQSDVEFDSDGFEADFMVDTESESEADAESG